MIRTFFVLMSLIFAVLLTPVAATAADTQTATLDVPGMTCGFCPITVRKALQKVPGVIKVQSSLETKTATVTFDPAKTTVKALTTATASAGYPSSLKQK